ncbi:MAG: GrpB family protein [Micrococcales bacterium]|nr:GrpB family protein [Micrococcales bacterium]
MSPDETARALEERADSALTVMLDQSGCRSLPELWRLFPVELRASDPGYPSWYRETAARLRQLLGDQVVRIHHIGSTSVPGLVAKPIVDLLLEIDPGSDPPAVVTALDADGWRLMAQSTAPHLRLDLAQGYTPTGFADRVFHLHIVHPGDHDELWFRNWLRTHPEAQADYTALKQDLAQRYEHDRDAYTEAKTTFVRTVVQQARQTTSG